MIVARVQHHPSRAALLPDLLDALAPLAVEVVPHSSDPPDPWAGYRLCLSDLPDCSHVLILQDDAQPVLGLSEALPTIAAKNLDVPVCLFMGSMPASTAVHARRAMQRNQRYVPLGVASFVPLVAVLWSRRKAQEFLRWSRDSRRITRADDGNAARWARQTRQQIMVTVPSLVEHNDFVPSVKGGREHKPGAESWRQALFLAEDAACYDW